MISGLEKSITNVSKTLLPIINENKDLTTDVVTLLDYVLDYSDIHDPVSIFSVMDLHRAINKKRSIRYLILAERAFDIVVSNGMYNKYYDSITLLSLACIYNLNPISAEEYLSKIRSKINDNYNTIFIDFFISVIRYYQGNYDYYESFLRRFRDSRNDKNYIFIPASTSLDKSIEHLDDTKNLAISERKDWVNLQSEGALFVNPSVAVSVSCDEVYFSKYKKYFINSFLEATKSHEDDGYIVCHVALVHQDEIDLEEFIYIEKISSGRIKFTFIKVDNEINIGPISASLRLHFANKLMLEYGCDLITMDFDCVIHEFPDEALKSNDFDISLRVINNVMPWERFAAGFTIYKNNEHGLEFLEYVDIFLNNYLTEDESQWWIDQNALEAAHRTMIKKRKNVKFHDIRPVLEKYIAMPTGSEKTKISTLDSNLKNINIVVK